MRGLADSSTSEQVGGWAPNSRLGSRCCCEEGRANFEYLCTQLPHSFAVILFFQLPPKVPGRVEYRGARFSCLAEEARPYRHASAARPSRAGLDAIVNSPFLRRKLPSERARTCVGRCTQASWQLFAVPPRAMGARQSIWSPCPWSQTLLHPVHRGFSRLE